MPNSLDFTGILVNNIVSIQQMIYKIKMKENLITLTSPILKSLRFPININLDNYVLEHHIF